MQQIDCITQQARERELTKRSQAERLAIANSLIASVWEEYLNGSIDRSTLQVAAYIQTNVNRIVWKLNELNNPNTPNTLKALDYAIRFNDIIKQAAIGLAEGLEDDLSDRDLPSAQPEIIRCKDCAKREYCRTSTVWAVAPSDDWYCADAERRTDE